MPDLAQITENTDRDLTVKEAEDMLSASDVGDDSDLASEDRRTRTELAPVSGTYPLVKAPGLGSARLIRNGRGRGWFLIAWHEREAGICSGPYQRGSLARK
jgi:hypothetical protein